MSRRAVRCGNWVRIYTNWQAKEAEMIRKIDKKKSKRDK